MRIMPRTCNGMRLQSALEYLSTYGWMIMLVAVALAALYEFGIFGNNPIYCTLNSNLACTNYVIQPDGTLTLTILQTTGNPINITAFSCTANATPTFTTIQSGEIQSGHSATLTEQCYDSKNNAFSGPTGSVYRGNIALRYANYLTEYPTLVYGAISVKVS